MDLKLMAKLKQKMVHEKKLIRIWEYFLDHFGEDQEFIELGGRVKHPFVEAMFGQVGKHFLNEDIRPEQIYLTGLPNENFIHGGVMVKGKLINVIYFTDINTGVISVVMSGQSTETKFIRFSGKEVGKTSFEPSVN